MRGPNRASNPLGFKQNWTNKNYHEKGHKEGETLGNNTELHKQLYY